MSFRVQFDEKELHHAVLCLSYCFPTTDRSTLDPPLEPASHAHVKMARQDGKLDRVSTVHRKKDRDLVEHSIV